MFITERLKLQGTPENLIHLLLNNLIRVSRARITAGQLKEELIQL